MIIVVKVDVFSYEEAILLITFEFGLWIHSVLRIEKKFSAKALSYGFPLLDIDANNFAIRGFKTLTPCTAYSTSCFAVFK